MIQINSKQRAYLRSLAHSLRPAVYIGKEGITEAVQRSIDNAFNTRELLKIKILESAPQTSSSSGKMLVEIMENVQLVQVIGRMIVLYRPYFDDPEIKLPK